jgi:hypothetical protein
LSLTPPVDAVVVAVGAWVVIARRAPMTALAGSCGCFFVALALVGRGLSKVDMGGLVKLGARARP